MVIMNRKERSEIMLYKCCECGHIFETPMSYEEYRGEYWGFPSYETMYCCPNCESTEFDDYEETDDEE